MRDQEYQDWLKDNKRNGNPKSTLPMVRLLRLLPAILAAHAALARCTLSVGSMNPSRRAEGLRCDGQYFERLLLWGMTCGMGVQGNLPRMLVDPKSTLEAAEAARRYDVHDDVRFYIFTTGGLPNEARGWGLGSGWRYPMRVP